MDYSVFIKIKVCYRHDILTPYRNGRFITDIGQTQLLLYILRNNNFILLQWSVRERTVYYVEIKQFHLFRLQYIHNPDIQTVPPIDGISIPAQPLATVLDFFNISKVPV